MSILNRNIMKYVMILLQYNFTHHPSWDWGIGYTQSYISKNKGTASVFPTQQSRNYL